MPSVASNVDLNADQDVHSPKPKLDHPINLRSVLAFLAIIALGLGYTAWSIYTDVKATNASVATLLPFIMLGVALFVALGFEFVNGFHDTANAVATVIYTHSLPANIAVVWSGFFNFLGVLFSTGAVAFGVVSLLPVELILQVGSQAGFAMVFALLIAAIIWNLGTWWLGLPASSSHTLIGSIIGVGIANALMRGRDGTSGVDWSKAVEIGYALLLSPLVGFTCAALLLLLLKFVVRKPELYQEPKGQTPPPLMGARSFDPNLHGRFFRSWIERRPKGYGPHHADPHRHRADGLCAESRIAGEPYRGIRLRLAGGFEGRGVQGGWL